MGIYVNPGNTAFRESINSPIYIDKTELIRYTNAAMCTYNKFICVSRPRRFGKCWSESIPMRRRRNTAV